MKYIPLKSHTFRMVLHAILFYMMVWLSHAASQPPNVIVIVADDLGYADMSFLPQSPSDIHTPNIDRLAEEGTYFSNAYSTSPICSPSRCGLVTGRYQQRWGNYWYGQGGLPKEELTLPQALRKRGYKTVKIGKTHLNGGEAEHPLDHGFDFHLGFLHHTWDYIRLSQEDLNAYQKKANGKPLGILNVGPLERDRGQAASFENGFTTDLFTDEAIKTIRQGKQDAKPFYIQLAYNAVHMPTYVTDPKYALKAGYEQPTWDREAASWEFPFWDPEKMSWKDWHANWGHLGKVDRLGRKRYLANLMALDDSIGRILKTLDQTGQREQTILVFLSDNGGTINTYANNRPLRGFKYMFGEGGVRIPLILSWPRQIPQGHRRSRLTSAMDIFPTILELCGSPVPSNLDGLSLVSKRTDPIKDKGHDHLCFTDGKGTWSVRQGDWKLIQSKGWTHSNYRLDADNLAHSSEDVEYPSGLLLFHLKEDIEESINVANEHEDLVRSMSQLYQNWRSQMGNPRSGKVKKR